MEITFDPRQISYARILQIYFSVAHDPTQLNRQGPDQGPQYRSAIFFANPEQQRVAQAYIAQLDQTHMSMPGPPFFRRYFELAKSDERKTRSS